MLRKNEIASTTSCLNKASDDEPIFVLRANDDCAPDIVMKWAFAYRASKVAQGEMTQRQMDKYEEAIDLAWQMRQWKAAKDCVHEPTTLDAANSARICVKCNQPV